MTQDCLKTTLHSSADMQHLGDLLTKQPAHHHQSELQDTPKARP